MPGYIYRGTDFDVPEEPAKKKGRPFDPSACGTKRGYKQHHRHYQDACPDCKKAYAADMAKRRSEAKPVKPKPVFNPEKCGTVAGYSQHRHYGVPLDELCRKANAEDAKARREKKEQNNERT